VDCTFNRAALVTGVR
jgi:hypothetical protein